MSTLPAYNPDELIDIQPPKYSEVIIEHRRPPKDEFVSMCFITGWSMYIGILCIFFLGLIEYIFIILNKGNN